MAGRVVLSDPNWPTAGEWLAGYHHEPPAWTMGIVGAPLNRASISTSRADVAPAAIRMATRRFSVWDVDAERDIQTIAVTDTGDLMLYGLSPEDALEPLAEKVRELRERNTVVVVLGGDNSVTRPGVHGTAPLERCGLITLDAHYDLREIEAGLTNGNPIRALLADGLRGPLVSQIGIQSFANSPRHAAVAKEAGINVITREEIAKRGIEACVSGELERIAPEVDAIYLDIDMDVLDRAFAPATPGSRPGGITPAELCRAAVLCGAHPSVAAVDIVEVSPPDDVADATVMAAARVLLAFASGLAGRPSA